MNGDITKTIFDCLFCGSRQTSVSKEGYCGRCSSLDKRQKQAAEQELLVKERLQNKQ